MDEDYARKLRAWLSAEPEATPRHPEEEREWLREVPAPQADPERWTVRGRLPREPVDELEEEWVCPVIALPVPRASEENGCRMSGPGEATADQSGASEPAERGQIRHLPTNPPGMSEAEARSRWNHPSNWHRRRREAPIDPDQPGSR
ncbi:hypothetical protein AB0J40_36135 [Amycolatopsis sp. NPDC049691]|uniref:hypothetical protein n=1 Tax=Amycolatopsis sp. NPDC049691 TaxID=3155155 RepID=UPI0034213730